MRDELAVVAPPEPEGSQKRRPVTPEVAGFKSVSLAIISMA
jgi:hypothetical protein